MSSVVITNDEYQKFTLQDQRELNPVELQQLPISFIKRGDGTYQTLSRYGDHVWEYPASRFPNSTPKSKRTVKFDTFPEQFVNEMKETVQKYENSHGGSSIISFVGYAKPFLEFLANLSINSLSEINPMICANYVQHCHKLKGRKKKIISSAAKSSRLQAVEMIQLLSVSTEHYFPMPWPDSSAHFLSGHSHDNPHIAKTEIIPDDVLKPIFKASQALLDRAEELLQIQSDLVALEEEAKQKPHKHGVISHKTRRLIKEKYLKRIGYKERSSKLSSEILDLQTACAIIIMTLSGIRIHELGWLRITNDEHGPWRPVEDKNHTLYWMQGKSDKTGEGECEWVIPKLATKALNIAQLYAKPLLKLWSNQLDSIILEDPNSTFAHQEREKLKSIFICKGKSDLVGPISGKTMINRLEKFAERQEITFEGKPFKITPHMFRRTFATHVAESALGDIRYLKVHFKHWSLDMTALYARHDKAHQSLIDEINTTIIDYKTAVIFDLLDEENLISGGAKESIVTFRNKDERLRTYNSRKEFAELLSTTVTIRPMGSAWCTSDTGGCGGRGLVERSRCGDCDGSIIDRRHVQFWAGLYLQMLELREIKDIGSAGQARVERDIQRCEKILDDLGVLEACKQEAAQEVTENDYV